MVRSLAATSSASPIMQAFGLAVQDRGRLGRIRRFGQFGPPCRFTGGCRLSATIEDDRRDGKKKRDG
jgi:hypothetical protein